MPIQTVYMFGDYHVDWNTSLMFSVKDRFTGSEVTVWTAGIEPFNRMDAAEQAQSHIETHLASQLFEPGTLLDYEVLRLGDDCRDLWIRGAFIVPVPREGAS